MERQKVPHPYRRGTFLLPKVFVLLEAVAVKLLLHQIIGMLEAARDAHRTLRQVEFRTQSADHPILWNSDESYYLKFFVFQVV